jgi:hypothetical protein
MDHSKNAHSKIRKTIYLQMYIYLQMHIYLQINFLWIMYGLQEKYLYQCCLQPVEASAMAIDEPGNIKTEQGSSTKLPDPPSIYQKL